MKNRHSLKSVQGFTLIEIAIVLVIIGLILGGILNAQSVIRNAQTKDLIKAVNDMSAGAVQFRDRYGFWPGDLPNAVNHFPVTVPATTCNGNGNGRVNTAAESICASEELIRAAMLKGTVGTPITVRGITLSVTSPALAGAFTPALPANWVNVVRIQNIDCDIALQLDRATDDGNVATGNFRTGSACAGQDETITVANAVLRLN